MLNDNDRETRTLAMPTAAVADRDDDVRDRQSIEALRSAGGYSLCDLAARAGMMPDHLRALESGLEPTIPERQAIASALSIDVEKIR